MIFRNKFSKKKQKLLERIKAKEDSLKTLNKSIIYLESQYKSLDDKCLERDELDFQKAFLSEKIDICKRRSDLCKKELDLLKKEGGV